jgi:hypothetical protein
VSFLPPPPLSRRRSRQKWRKFSHRIPSINSIRQY